MSVPDDTDSNTAMDACPEGLLPCSSHACNHWLLLLLTSARTDVDNQNFAVMWSIRFWQLLLLLLLLLLLRAGIDVEHQNLAPEDVPFHVSVLSQVFFAIGKNDMCFLHIVFCSGTSSAEMVGHLPPSVWVPSFVPKANLLPKHYGCSCTELRRQACDSRWDPDHTCLSYECATAIVSGL